MSPASAFSKTIQTRGNLENSRLQFERRHRGNVAFIGGSITEMHGYRPLVGELLQNRFLQTDFVFTNAGIASTCSDTGAFRLQRDVLDHGPVDLLFVEFAVNDDQDGHFSRTDCIRGMEGIIRQARLRNPCVDIVMIFFVNEAMLRSYQDGQTPLAIAAHETVAQAYAIPSINVAKQLADEIASTTMTWLQYGGVHPAPAGAALCARMIDTLFSHAWDRPLTAEFQVQAHALPAKPLDNFSYFNGRLIDPRQARVKNGWTWTIPDWNQLPGETRERFTAIPMLCATDPGAEATLTFEGTAAGAFIVAGPDAGTVEASIDGGPARTINLFAAHSHHLHYPRTVMLGTELPPGPHLLTLRFSVDTQAAERAMRIIQFTAN